MALFLFCTTPAMAGWQIVNDNKITAASTDSCATTFGASGTVTIASTIQGNALIGAFVVNGSSTVTITGFEENGTAATWTEAVSAPGASTSAVGMSDIWFHSNIAAGITTVVISCSITETLIGHIYEVSGLATSSMEDGSGATLSNQTATGMTPISPAFTTTQSGDFIVAVIDPATAVTGIHVGNEFTEDGTATENGNNGFAHITSTSATAASHQAQWDDTVSADPYGTVIAAFKVAGGARPCTIALLGVGTC